METGFVLCICYCLIGVSTYFVWPSRWNVHGHINLAFAVFAYVIPVLVLDMDSRFPSDVIRGLTHLMIIGTVFYLAGLALGTLLAGSRPTPGLVARVARLDRLDLHTTSSRLAMAVFIGVVLTVIAAVGLGGFPLFAEDPYSAKYFRGEYKASSTAISALYRIGTGTLTVLLPLAVLMAFRTRKRKVMWIWLSGVATFCMVATLQRGPMAEGLLVLVTAFLITRRRYVLAALTITASFIVGTLFYEVLRVAGVGQFAGGRISRLPILNQIASTAPDVTDTLSFFSAWTRQGEPLTGGRTMWGGLVPAQFEWNPAVWSLVTQNFGTDINAIRSGGLRLPVPVWGAVNFGEISLWLIPAITGILTGFLVKRLSSVIPTQTLFGTTSLLLLMGMGLLTLGNFYILAYLEVFKLAVLLWVLWPGIRRVKDVSPGPWASRVASATPP